MIAPKNLFTWLWLPLLFAVSGISMACTVINDSLEVETSPSEYLVSKIDVTVIPTFTPISTLIANLATATNTPSLPISTPTPRPTRTPLATPVIALQPVVEFDPMESDFPRAQTGIKDMAVVSETDIWAVGTNGIIAHWDGNTWSPIDSPTTVGLAAVHFISPTNGWAVGSGSIILHWDGEGWEIVQPYTPPRMDGSGAISYLTDIAFLSPTEGWAIGYWDTEGGSVGIILRWDGEIWQQDSADLYGCSCILRSINMISSSEGWIVGGSTQNFLTQSSGIFRWDGQTWSFWMNETNANPLVTVHGFSSDFAWAAGIENLAYDTRSYLLQWDGETWLEINPPRERGWISFVLTITPDDGWLVRGANQVFHWNGVSWTVIQNEVMGTIVALDVTSSGRIIGINDSGVLMEFTLEGVKSWAGSQ